MATPDYTDAQEAQCFTRELEAVHRRFPNLPVAEATTQDLLIIYRRLEADLPPFGRLLRQNLSQEADYASLLLPHLEGWLSPEDQRPPLLASLIYLDARGAEPEVLRELKELPTYLATPDHLGILRSAPLSAHASWIEFQGKHGPAFSEELNHLAFRFLLDIFFHDELLYRQNDLLAEFLRDILPLYQEKFPDEHLPQCYHRVADWVKFFFQHRDHHFPHLPVEDELYHTAIENIIRFIPGILWWNNGIPYQRGRKAFDYHSEEFRWLARGNSLRKLPRHPTYSKAMAKAFNNLAHNLDTEEGDLYTYCLVLSLGGRPQLGKVLPRYFTRPEDAAATAAWREMMDPLIQKLVTFRDLDWETEEGDRLLGYLYHIFRDQPQYPLDGRTQNSLLRDAHDWYDRIEQRRQELLDRQAAARAAWEASLQRDHWPALSDAPEWSEKFGRYDAIRARKIVELTTETQLRAESRVLSHCVSTYAMGCKRGQCSIWSLRELRQNGTWYSILTIQVIPEPRSIVQVRGRMNRAASREEMDIVEGWARQAKLNIGLLY
ncbi:PcfJ domain-containing protein [Lewinella sp. W8]|uniref:PcfJ domain-containing protein n=1 Tax=Lewinella sp. W8 TaxID=2528208 RepID=UPI0010675B79|nr:PcfJ domain-containing protein [Lewinella sp. W8]MTB49777.1 hypothetical protein [Lewinella sp. W8]